jgi:hypothetical protein
MLYFEKHLNDATTQKDIDISVHCDIKIFEWLLEYIRKKEGLIESNLLMPDQYIAKHV